MYFVLKKDVELYIINKNKFLINLVEVKTNGYSIIEKMKPDDCRVENYGMRTTSKISIVLETHKLIGKLLNSDIYYFSKIGLINNDNVEWQSLLKNLYNCVSAITGTRSLTEEEIKIVEES